MRYTEEFEDDGGFDSEMPPTLIKRLKPAYTDKTTARRMADHREARNHATAKRNAKRVAARRAAGTIHY